MPSPEAVGLKIDVMRGHNHPKTGVNHYRIEGEDRAVVYATDTEGFRCGDRRLIEFAESADVLIHDAMFSEAQYTEMPNPTQGYGHATPVDAARVADKAGVERLVLFHHSPTSSDDDLNGLESDAREIFPESVLARDGMTLEV
ncbi:MAG: MBL fold metallo-hydrolase [Bradymonadaceae bacterium]